MKKSIFKTLLCTVLCVLMVFSAVACGDKGGDNPAPNDYTRPSNANIDESFAATGNVLVAYFSKTNTTESVARAIREFTDADIFEIERKEPYPNDYTPTTEEAREEKDANARPELKTYLADEVMARYDTIILGFPIWWHTAPMPVLSFLNYYDLSGKTIYTFCTAATSPITESTADIRKNADGATVTEGRKFSGGSDGSIETWLNGLGLIKNDDDAAADGGGVTDAQYSNVLIVYFSWSQTTEKSVNALAASMNGETVWEIVPEEPYEGSYNDVAYGRAKDEADNDIHPPIVGEVENIAEYDAVIIAYPIWWHTIPMVVATFLDDHDLSGTDIYPMSQSASMDRGQFEQSVNDIKKLEPAATVHDGIFTKNDSDIESYFKANGFPF